MCREASPEQDINNEVPPNSSNNKKVGEGGCRLSLDGRRNNTLQAEGRFCVNGVWGRGSGASTHR